MSLEEKCFSETHSYHLLKKMSQMIMSLFVIILAILSNANGQMSQPQFTIKAESNKAFDESCLIGNFTIANENIADCLEHCLENCSCQSFQICQNTQCQLCSSNKEDNSSLLHEKNGCVYATYEMRHLTETSQKMGDQCSGMSCLLKYNCCQQLGLCPKNKICKPVYNITQPWKRFTCECPDGYHGDNCDEPITSCRGYSNGSRQSRKYKVLDSEKLMYEVYCHFDSDGRGTWTLVQSYSYAKFKSDNKFKESALSRDWPVNENVPNWSEYRLSKTRMKSIQNDSVGLAFTCDSEKPEDVNLDYVVIPFQQQNAQNTSMETIDIINLDERKHLSAVRGQIRAVELNNCSIWLSQGKGNNRTALHIDINVTANCPPLFTSSSCTWKKINYFGNYNYKEGKCLNAEHHCVKNNQSTTQLWFGN